MLGGSLAYINQAVDQKLLTPLELPEAAAFPASLKSGFWVATDTQFLYHGMEYQSGQKADEPKEL